MALCRPPEDTLLGFINMICVYVDPQSDAALDPEDWKRVGFMACAPHRHESHRSHRCSRAKSAQGGMVLLSAAFSLAACRTASSCAKSSSCSSPRQKFSSCECARRAEGRGTARQGLMAMAMVRLSCSLLQVRAGCA